MSLAIRAEFDPLRTLSYTYITSTFYPVGSALAHPARAIYILNDTDKLLSFSFDGINEQVRLPALGYWWFDISSNKTVPQGWFLSEGKRLYVKTPTTNPTQGEVNFTVVYGVDL
jgi:hypothetical protein